MSIMLLRDPPKFPEEFHNEFGYRPDYMGLGVFLYRSESRNRWYLMAHQNNGLSSITAGRNLDQLIDPKWSCEFDLQQGERGGIRIKILYDYIYVYKREANGDTNYQKCIVSQIRDPYFHHMAIVSNNQENDKRISSFDVDSVYIKNWDPNVYQDKVI